VDFSISWEGGVGEEQEGGSRERSRERPHQKGEKIEEEKKEKEKLLENLQRSHSSRSISLSEHYIVHHR